MRPASTALINFLNTTQGAAIANLYTFALASGTALRLTDAPTPVTINGHTYAVGPTVRDSGVTLSRGLSVDNLEISLGANYAVSGTPFMAWIRGGGLDGSTVTVERAFAPSFGQAFVGSYVRFVGRYSEARSVSRSGAVIVVASWAELLNQQVPSEVYQASCSNQLYDGACGVSRASYQATATVNATAAPTTTSFSSTIGSAASTYDLGSILFTSGANAGLRRSVKHQAVSGVFTVYPPLPVAPASGDAFTAYPGCDRSTGPAGCGRFANTARFRGQPYIPNPTTLIGGAQQ